MVYGRSPSSRIKPRRARGVQAGCRLVEDQDLRVHCEHCRDGNALLLPFAEVVGEPAGVSGHINLAEGPGDPGMDLRFGAPHMQRPERYILKNRGGEKLVVGVLKYQPNQSPDMAEISLSQRLTGNLYQAIALQDAVQMEQQGAFPRAVWADRPRLSARGARIG